MALASGQVQAGVRFWRSIPDVQKLLGVAYNTARTAVERLKLQREKASSLSVQGVPLTPSKLPSVTNQSSQEAKIAIFRSLFRGRDDVYPKRFESQKTGKKGYQPDCRNEWVKGVWRGTLTQYAGRLHRLNEAKKDVIIYDYVDFEVPVLARMYARRRAGYRAIGYGIVLPGNERQTGQLFLTNP